jgi:hypothetical protein
MWWLGAGAENQTPARALRCLAPEFICPVKYGRPICGYRHPSVREVMFAGRGGLVR